MTPRLQIWGPLSNLKAVSHAVRRIKDPLLKTEDCIKDRKTSHIAGLWVDVAYTENGATKLDCMGARSARMAYNHRILRRL